MRLASTFTLVTILFSSLTAQAVVIHVPADEPTIQAGINAAGNGDTVLVAPGTYLENINFDGKRIEVKSSGGPYSTVIDGDQSGTVVMFNNGEGPDTLLQGFTVTNGLADGGGIICDGASPTLTDLTVSENSSTGHGGGLLFNNCGSTISGCRILSNYSFGYGAGLNSGIGGTGIHFTLIDCLFEGNYAHEGRGGGIYCGGVAGSSFTVTNCTFLDNSTGPGMRGAGMSVSGYQDLTVTNCMFFGNESGYLGGALYFFCQIPPVVTNCTFVENSGLNGGAIYNYGCDTVITNCIMWNNSPGEIFNYNNADPVVKYCDVMGGYPGTGNIDADPLFADEANGDLHLKFQSPCKDTGRNSAVSELTDFEGDARIEFGNVDMGADEFHKHLYVTGDKTPGGLIKAKLVDHWGTSPVGLFIGSGVLEVPLNTIWGDFWLEAPWLMFPLTTIPSNGILVIKATVPPTPTGPYHVPLQALIGLDPDSLSNLEILTVE